MEMESHKHEEYQTNMNNPTANNQELPLSASVFTSLLSILFGANSVAIKLSLSGLGAFTTAGLRFSMAVPVIFFWARITRRSFRVDKNQLYQLLIVSFVFIIQLSSLYLGFSRTNASRGTLLINLQPFFVLFLAHYFIPGDRITLRKSFGLFLGFTGMSFVFLGKQGVTSDIRIGDTMILFSAVLWACNTVYMKKIISGFDPFQLILYPMIFSIPFFLLAGSIWDSTMIADMNLKVLGSLLYQSVITASFGWVAWNTLLRKYGAVSLHSFLFIMPVAGVLLGGLVLGEPLNLNIFLALFLIVSGILSVNLRTKKYTPIYPSRGV